MKNSKSLCIIGRVGGKIFENWNLPSSVRSINGPPTGLLFVVAVVVVVGGGASGLVLFQGDLVSPMPPAGEHETRVGTSDVVTVVCDLTQTLSSESLRLAGLLSSSSSS